MATFYRYADTVGDGSGISNAVIDASAAPVVLKITPRNNESRLRVNRLIVFIKDGGSFDSGSYGNGVILTNGISLGVYRPDGTLKVDLNDGIPIKINVDWNRLCYDTSVSNYGQGSESLSVRWSFDRAGGPIHLPAGYYIGVRLNDDFTGLEEHCFNFQGVIDE